MKIQEVELTEGLYDKYIFKAFFTAGGPGSGKSHVSKKLLNRFGFKTVDIDRFIELFGKKHNLDLKNMDDWRGNYIHRAADLNHRSLDTYLAGRLPLIIDGTGRNKEKIKYMAERLKTEFGYDSALLYVNTSINVALKRNSQRPRSIAPQILVNMHKEVKNNLGFYQNYFDDRMFIVDNNEETMSDENLDMVSKRLMRFLNAPVNNLVAKQWIQKQQELKGIKQDSQPEVPNENQ